jgi:hypothetical protein
MFSHLSDDRDSFRDVMPVDLAVGAVLMSLPAVPFPAYLRTGRAWGSAPLADLHDGGLIMLAGSELIMTGLAILLAFDFFRSHERAGGRLAADLAAYNAGLAAQSARSTCTPTGRASSARRRPGSPGASPRTRSSRSGSPPGWPRNQR